ncbi:DNA polymerase exonuclease subunit [Thiohalocapsa phage LS06-2018-MD03]|nr:DNA polymerase exonuclease subunit [Thiohalocapsa phage LS06-2018-MD03]
MRKLWLDVETTGLDDEKNGLIQIACIMVDEKDKKILDYFEANIKPFKGCIYTDEAEVKHGKSKKDISKFTPEKNVLESFIKWLQKYQKGNQQFQIAGYNSRFDQDFISAWFKRNKENFWLSFNYYDIDVFAMVKELDLSGTYEGRPSKKLQAICDAQGVDLKDAHDALADIIATRKLYKKLKKRYYK